MRLTPMISVVMPVYNAERYVRQAAESVLNQTLGDLELLIINDGSTDSSEIVVASLRDPRVRILSREHRGVSFARNQGLALARGEFIAFMDADDISDHHRFARQVSFLREHPGVDVVGTWMEYSDEGSDHRSRVKVCPPTRDVAIRLQMLRSNCFVNGSVMFRRAAAAHLFFRGQLLGDVDYAEDYDFWLRLSEAHSVANIPTALYWLRGHTCSATRRLGEERYVQARERVQRLALQRLLTGRDEFGCRLQGDHAELGDQRSRQDKGPHIPREVLTTLCAWTCTAAQDGQFRLACALARRALNHGAQRPNELVLAVWRVISELSCPGVIRRARCRLLRIRALRRRSVICRKGATTY